MDRTVPIFAHCHYREVRTVSLKSRGIMYKASPKSADSRLHSEFDPTCSICGHLKMAYICLLPSLSYGKPNNSIFDADKPRDRYSIISFTFSKKPFHHFFHCVVTHDSLFGERPHSGRNG